MTDPEAGPPETGPQAPVTTTTDLETGIFNLVVALTLAYRANGTPGTEANERVAQLLLRYIAGLRQPPSPQGADPRRD